MSIPLIIIEEHHEAYLAWNWAIRRGIIPESRVTLLHVDEHADASVPRLRSALPDPGDAAAVRAFVYSELEISSFIWPAVFQRRFHRWIWYRRAHAWGSFWRTLEIHSPDGGGKQFAIGMPPTRDAVTPGARLVNHAGLTPSDTLDAAGPLILDIDLDYFCANEFPNFGRRRVEITCEAFEEIEADPYHVLRIGPGLSVSRVRENGRCYIVINDFESRETEVTEAELEARLGAFSDWLSANSIQPALMTICRSLHSGFLPAKWARFLEERTLGLLARFGFENTALSATYSR